MINTDLVHCQLNRLQYPSVGDMINEFSTKPCWTCGSPLAGTRYALNYVDEDEVYHEAICLDCAYYIANGEELED